MKTSPRPRPWKQPPHSGGRTGGAPGALGFRGNTLTLKIKFPDFVQKSRSITVPDCLTDMEDILPLARTMMEELDSGDSTFRLLGLSVSNPLEEHPPGVWEQLWLDLEY